VGWKSSELVLEIVGSLARIIGCEKIHVISFAGEETVNDFNRTPALDGKLNSSSRLSSAKRSPDTTPYRLGRKSRIEPQRAPPAGLMAGGTGYEQECKFRGNPPPDSEMMSPPNSEK
jgi:hypothetical protein